MMMPIHEKQRDERNEHNYYNQRQQQQQQQQQQEQQEEKIRPPEKHYQHLQQQQHPQDHHQHGQQQQYPQQEVGQEDQHIFQSPSDPQQHPLSMIPLSAIPYSICSASSYSSEAISTPHSASSSSLSSAPLCGLSPTASISSTPQAFVKFLENLEKGHDNCNDDNLQETIGSIVVEEEKKFEQDTLDFDGYELRETSVGEEEVMFDAKGIHNQALRLYQSGSQQLHPAQIGALKEVPQELNGEDEDEDQDEDDDDDDYDVDDHDDDDDNEDDNDEDEDDDDDDTDNDGGEDGTTRQIRERPSDEVATECLQLIIRDDAQNDENSSQQSLRTAAKQLLGEKNFYIEDNTAIVPFLPAAPTASTDMSSFSYRNYNTPKTVFSRSWLYELDMTSLFPACHLVRNLLNQIELHDSPPINDNVVKTKSPSGQSLEHDSNTTKTSSANTSPHGYFQDLLFNPPFKDPGTDFSWWAHYQYRQQGKVEQKLGHAALATMCAWTLQTMDIPDDVDGGENEDDDYHDQESYLPNSMTITLQNSTTEEVQSFSPQNSPQEQPAEDTKQTHKKKRWLPWQKKTKSQKNKPLGASKPEDILDKVVATTHSKQSKTEELSQLSNSEVSKGDVPTTPSPTNLQLVLASVQEDRMVETLSKPKIRVNRLQMFGSEYARHLSQTILGPDNTQCKSPSNRYTTLRSSVSASASVTTASTGRSRRGKSTAAMTWDLDQTSSDVQSGAIIDIVVTYGEDSPPPTGYYRISFDGEGITPLKAGKLPVYINVKKEPSWDKAAQRPCITALTIIFPDRQEFVPPGFCVVRRYKRLNRTPDTSVTSSQVQHFPANLNQGSKSGERVYLCYRRSREGNPMTGITLLQPSKQQAIQEGYTVLERTPRNHVAMVQNARCSPVFLAYRQRLANLETLRPMPLLLSGVQKIIDLPPTLRAYYGTGGSVVPALVGRFHIMDRSTHCLLSPSSVKNRLTLMEVSRRRTAKSVATSIAETFSPKYAASEDMSTPRSGSMFSGDVSVGDLDMAASVDANSGIHDNNLDISIQTADLGTPSGRSSRPRRFVEGELSESTAEVYQALSFIPDIETATENESAKSLLRARIVILTPILTACYTRHGGCALTAVEGLTTLLTTTNFFSDDVYDGSQSSLSKLTLLELSIQVVCDVATAGAQETTFGTCVEFVQTAVQYTRGQFNTRTAGYILRLYLFVFYFGASIPTSKHLWYPKNMVDDIPILSDPRTPESKYLHGGAPQLAALSLKELISIFVTRLRKVTDKDARILAINSGSETLNHMIDGLLSSLIDGAVHRVEIANYTQLAMHQIHRSGGSELFWHDMVTSCGKALFGKDNTLSVEAQHMYITCFAVLAKLVKVCSGRFMRKAFRTIELRPRDMSSKLLTLELLQHFLVTWRDEQKQMVGEKIPSAVETLAFSIRRLVIPCLLSNTRMGLVDARVFKRVIRIITILWCAPVYRDCMKVELGVLIDHFALRMLQLGPQFRQKMPSSTNSSDYSQQFCLLMQQVDLLKEIKEWFSADVRSTIEMYLNFDTDISSQLAGPTQLLPGTEWKIFQKLAAGLCSLAEQCGELIGEQIKESQFASNFPAKASTSEAQHRQKEAQPKLSQMTLVREGARMVRKAALDAISQAIKCLAICAAAATGRRYYDLVTSWTPRNVSPVFDDFSHELSSIHSSDDSSHDDDSVSSDDESFHESDLIVGGGRGDDGVLHYWRAKVMAAGRDKDRSEERNRLEHGDLHNHMDSGTLLTRVTRDTAFEIAKKKNLKKAIEYLVACNALSPSPRDIASFLRIHKDGFDQTTLGGYLGETGTDGAENEYWDLIRFSYVRAISFDGMNVEEGLRHFLTNCGFHLPGEAQKIDRIISTFAQCYWEDNAGDSLRCPFRDQDTVFLLSFAIIMLNTDLHKSNGTHGKRGRKGKPITKQEFLTNFKGVDLSEEFSRSYLSAIYDSIEKKPIVLTPHTKPQGHTSPNESRRRMLREILNNVRTVDAVLRGLSVHDFKWAYVEDFSVTMDYEGSGALSDLARSCIAKTWHQFYGVVNTALETAHLDPQGMEPCVDVLKYALCATICLEMPMERAAFLGQLGRYKVFEDRRQGQWLPAVEPHQLLDVCATFEAGCLLNEDSKLLELEKMNELINGLRSALTVDMQVKKTMTRVVHQIINGEFLLNDPLRTFVRDGFLKKKCNRSGRLIEYRFFLFSDVLIYAKKQKKKNMYKIHEELALHLMKVVDWFPPQGSDLKRAFQIHHPRKKFLVYASSKEERMAWVSDIRSSTEREVQRKVEVEAARLAANMSRTADTN